MLSLFLGFLGLHLLDVGSHFSPLASLDHLQLLLQLFPFLGLFRFFLSLFLLFALALHFSQAVQALVFLELQVEGSTEFVLITDAQSVFQLFHVLFLG